MPDTTSPSGPEPPASTAAPPRGKSRAIIAGVLCVGLAAGGYVMGGRVAGGEPAAASEPVHVPEPTIGEIVDLAPVNVNLADGHYLRIAVSLGLSDAHASDAPAADDGHGNPVEAEGSRFPTAPAADLVLSTFAGRKMDQLAAADGREQARQDLLDGIHDYYGDEEVLTVFFTEFVMQ
ncbi:MAG TPA: flagellar basal body-associated FliL family protein [Ilumatobacter sp.]|nr:flagellar basal body-associated FliL family protein [Ilumatobacter sp.]